MPTKPTEGPGFAEAIDASLPNPDGRDLPTDGFPSPLRPNQRMVDTSREPEKVEGAAVYDFSVGREIFIISRSWESCTRCQDDRANQVVTIPLQGDYVCPHTRIAEYKAVINRALAGEIILKSETEIINTKGDMVSVSVYWFEKKFNHKRKRRMQREAARRGGPAPDPDDAEDEE